MTEGKILAELRTIRTLLSIDKEQRLNEMTSGLSDIQEQVLDELAEEWSAIPTSDIAEQHDVSKRTVQRQVGELEEMNLVEKKGAGGGTEYRTTGLSRAAELVSTD